MVDAWHLGREASYYALLKLAGGNVFALLSNARDAGGAPVTLIEGGAIDELIRHGFRDDFIAAALEVDKYRVRRRRKRLEKRGD